MMTTGPVYEWAKAATKAMGTGLISWLSINRMLTCGCGDVIASPEISPVET